MRSSWNWGYWKSRINLSLEIVTNIKSDKNVLCKSKILIFDTAEGIPTVNPTSREKKNSNIKEKTLVRVVNKWIEKDVDLGSSW